MGEMVRVAAGAVLFDCDGVLVDSGASIQRTWVRWAAGHDLDGVAIHRAARGRRTIDTIRAVAEHLDAAAEDRIFEQMECDDAHTVTAMPGATRALAAAASRAAVVTSGARRLATARLAAAGLQAPAVMIAGDDVAKGKSDPQGYLLAARRPGVASSECVVIEDADAGIQAGLAAGCTVVVVGADARRRDDERAFHVESQERLELALGPIVTSRETTAPRAWGDGCLAWELLADPQIAVIEEEMPAGTSEAAHHHRRATQYIFVLAGALRIASNGTERTVQAGHGALVPAGLAHAVHNDGPGIARFLAIASPSTIGDRIEGGGDAGRPIS